MLQDVIAAKHNDLSLCIKRRHSILRELFRLTTRYGGTYTEEGERLFLHANDIVEGRSFNAATLPPVTLHASHDSDHQLNQSWNKPLNEPQRVATPSLEVPTRPISGEDPISPPGLSKGHASTSATPPDTRGPSTQQDGLANKSTDQLQSKTEATPVPIIPVPVTDPSDFSANPDPYAIPTSEPDSALSVGTDSIDPSRALPLSTDEAGVLSQATFKTIAAEQRSTPASNIHLPPKELQQKRLQGVHEAGHDSEITLQDALSPPRGPTGQGSLEDAGKAAADEAVQKPLNDLTQDRRHQDDNRDLYGAVEDQEAESGHSHTSPTNKSTTRSQINVVKAGSTFVGTPSTPDEQLRLEEAQALQSSRLTPPVSQGVGKHEPTAVSGDPSLQSLHEHMVEEQQMDDIAATFTGDKLHGSSPLYGDIVPDNPSAILTPGIREHTFPGMTGSLSKDLTFSRRPPMRIDTAVPSTSDSMRSLPSRRTTTPGAATPFTPSETVKSIKSGPPTAQIQSPPERMTTRVSSGALRHKSVSEILGETPRHSAFHIDKASNERAASADEHALHTPKSAGSMAWSEAANFRQRLGRLDEKERSKPPTVVFARQLSSSGYRQGESASKPDGDFDNKSSEPKDYLLPLFAAQAAAPSPAQQLHSLVSSAHKTIATVDHCTDFQEQQDCRILTRIYQLQNSGRWSLRQHERSAEPGRPKAHWDVLMSQMQWMRTDFREERKWKLAAAKGLADACAQWVASSTEERDLLQIKVRPPSASADPASVYLQTPELVPSREDDSSDMTDFESSDFEASKRSAPARIFSLPPDMFVFGLDRTPIADKILSELPLYQPSVQREETVLDRATMAPEDAWRTSVIPFSKFVKGKMVTRDQGPPRKKSRFDYSDGQEVLYALEGDFGESSAHEQCDLGPEQDDVALFRQENKHIRDRIHAGHAFRPPSEYLMPSQSFFESRQSSQWVQAEDDELRKLVREYAYNWSLISSCLSTPSLFYSGAERRTPWECFERWVGFEGLPAEMSKTQYFKAYHSRLQAAQRTHEQLALQQHQGNSTAQMPLRRRTALPLLVDRRKNSKHLHLVNAMQKLARKRESALQKQQHVAGLAAMRKQNEAVQPRNSRYTPQELSRVKWERDQKQQEIARALHQQHLQQQREKAKTAQRSGQAIAAPNMMPRGPTYPLPVNGSSPNGASAIPNVTTQAAAMNQLRQMPAIPRLSNTAQGINSVPSNSQGVLPAPMQSQMQGQHRMAPQMMSDDTRVYHEALKVSNQQRALATQAQHQHPQSQGHSGTSASPNMGRVNGISHHNASLFSGIQGRSGSPSINGAPILSGSSASPRMTSSSQPQPLSNGTIPLVNQIQDQVKAGNPQASPEQINAMTTARLGHYRNQAAMQAAAANPNAAAMAQNASIGVNGNRGSSQSQQQSMMNGVNGRSMMNPQEYAQMMRSQQSSQQSRSASTGMHSARTTSRSATPQTHPGHAPSQSPRPATAQMAQAQ